MAGDSGTQYREIMPGVGAPQVAGPGGPVRQDVGQAGTGFKALADFGKEAAGYADRLQEIADLNTVAQKTSEHGMAATDATAAWKNSLTGTNPKDELAEFNRRMDEVDARSLDGVQGRAAQILKTKLATHRPVFYEAATRAIDAAGKQATLTTGAGLAESAAKSAMQMPDPMARDALFGSQVANFYAAQVAAGSISVVEEGQYVKNAWDNFQYQIAKNQAETAPSLFLAGIKKGPNGEPSEWEKRLTPEALNHLGPDIKKAQGDNTLLTVADQFRAPNGAVNWRAAANYAADPKNKPADVPADQWTQVLQAAQVRVHMADSAQAKARSDNEYYTQVNVSKMVNSGNLAGAMDLVRKSNLPITHQQSILSSLAAGAQKIDDPRIYSEGLDSITKGTWTDNWGLQQLNSGSLSYDGFERLRKVNKEADIPTIAALKDGQHAITEAFAKSMMASGTQEQAEAGLAARRELAQAVETARMNGKDVTELVTPGKPGYVLGDIIRRNTLTMNQQIKAMSDKINSGQSSGPSYRPAPGAPGSTAGQSAEIMRGLGVAPQPTAGVGNPVTLAPTNGSKMRLPGESISQWRERTGGM